MSFCLFNFTENPKLCLEIGYLRPFVRYGNIILCRREVPKLNRSLHPPYSFTIPKELLKVTTCKLQEDTESHLSFNVQNKFHSAFLTSAQWRALEPLSVALQQAKLTCESTEPAATCCNELHHSLMSDSTHPQNEYDHCSVLTTASN